METPAVASVGRPKANQLRTAAKRAFRRAAVSLPAGGGGGDAGGGGGDGGARQLPQEKPQWEAT